MSLINTQVQPFKVNAFHNGKFIEVTEESLKGKWSVLIFMPAAFTFNCPTEIEDAANSYAEFQKAETEVYIVTTDTHFSHKAWHDSSPAIGKIEYTMLGDPSGLVTNNFDAMRPGVGLADRATFLVDPDGVIQFVSVTPDAVGRNVDEVLLVLDATVGNAKFYEICGSYFACEDRKSVV